MKKREKEKEQEKENGKEKEKNKGKEKGIEELREKKNSIVFEEDEDTDMNMIDMKNIIIVQHLVILVQYH